VDLKLPFACSYLPGKSKVHMAVWYSVIMIDAAIFKAAQVEQTALLSGAGFAVMVTILALAAGAARWGNGLAAEDATRFDEQDAETVIVLGI
jgi:hypothetical protein